MNPTKPESSHLKSVSPLLPTGTEIETVMSFYQNQLGFEIVQTEGKPIKMAIAQRDDIRLFLVKSDNTSANESISLLIQVENIEELYSEYQSKNTQENVNFFHPNGGELAAKPWGLKEFIILDPTGVCITFYQPISSDN